MCYQNENLGWGGYLLANTVTVYTLSRILRSTDIGMENEYIRRHCICQVVLKNANFIGFHTTLFALQAVIPSVGPFSAGKFTPVVIHP